MNLDRFAPLRELFDSFVRHCKYNYCSSEFVTVDEMLPGFRGKCKFCQYIPSKSSKYDFKIFALCDSKMSLDVDVGTQPQNSCKDSNTQSDVVPSLCQNIFDTGRNITMDNWFSSILLIETLFNEHKNLMLSELFERIKKNCQ